MPLSPDTMNVLDALRAHAERKLPNGWAEVYLDNAKPARMSPHSFAGHLSVLREKGLYRPVDGNAFGDVQMLWGGEIEDRSFFSFYPSTDGRRVSYGAEVGKPLCSDSRWIVPATCPDDPSYEASYAMLAYARAHRIHYWLGQYPQVSATLTPTQRAMIALIEMIAGNAARVLSTRACSDTKSRPTVAELNQTLERLDSIIELCRKVLV
jgi:hypothetical protein